MPIRPELRKLYRGPEYRERRKRILERAGNRCEQCGVPNNSDIDRANGGWWLEVKFKPGMTGVELKWRDEHGTHVIPLKDPKMRGVRVVLAVAHLNNDPEDNREENLRAYCQWCHLHHDLPVHQAHAKQTRIRHKDAARPMLAAIEASA